MLQRSVVITAAWLEIAVGAIILAAPNVTCGLLFGAEIETVGMALARFAGVALIGLGISCLPSAGESRRHAALGLLTFNTGVVILFVWLGIATTLRGLLLWPAVLLHALIATVLAIGTFSRGGAQAAGMVR